MNRRTRLRPPSPSSARSVRHPLPPVRQALPLHHRRPHRHPRLHPPHPRPSQTRTRTRPPRLSEGAKCKEAQVIELWSRCGCGYRYGYARSQQCLAGPSTPVQVQVTVSQQRPRRLGARLPSTVRLASRSECRTSDSSGSRRENVTFHDVGLMDNTFEARVCDPRWAWHETWLTRAGALWSEHE